MPRPKKCRFISSSPSVTFFKPSGIPKALLEEVILEADELEAVRLADLEGLYQEDAASKMNISRQTFGNMLVSAHKKIAQAIVNGKVIKIEGGVVSVNVREQSCVCGYQWHESIDSETCPKCNAPRMPFRGGRGRRRRQFS